MSRSFVMNPEFTEHTPTWHFAPQQSMKRMRSKLSFRQSRFNLLEVLNQLQVNRPALMALDGIHTFRSFSERQQNVPGQSVPDSDVSGGNEQHVSCDDRPGGAHRAALGGDSVDGFEIANGVELPGNAAVGC